MPQKKKQGITLCTLAGPKREGLSGRAQQQPLKYNGANGVVAPRHARVPLTRDPDEWIEDGIHECKESQGRYMFECTSTTMSTCTSIGAAAVAAVAATSQAIILKYIPRYSNLPMSYKSGPLHTGHPVCKVLSESSCSNSCVSPSPWKFSVHGPMGTRHPVITAPVSLERVRYTTRT